jgi:outer membrane receptor protein involved in Fe transport
VERHFSDGPCCAWTGSANGQRRHQTGRHRRAIFDGDPPNLNATLLSAVVVNLHAAWQFDERWQLFWLVNNLFENRDALYGYFDPGGTSALVTSALTDARTLIRRQPVSFLLGVKLKF